MGRSFRWLLGSSWVTFADTTASMLLPMVVEPPDLGVGNARITAGLVTAPFWFGFVGSALLVVLRWPQLTNIAHADGGVVESPRGDQTWPEP